MDGVLPVELLPVEEVLTVDGVLPIEMSVETV